MIIEVLVNGKEESFKVEDNLPIYKIITKIRNELKTKYKSKKKIKDRNCELWFTNIII